MVASLVSVLGLSAILITRITRQSQESLTDATAANMYAQSALRLGMLMIEEDPNWRYSHTGSAWATDIPIGDGTYSLTVVDPSDNNLADAPADPVVMTGIGRQGSAIRQTQITLAPLYRGYDCLQSGIHSADDVYINDAYVSSDGLISANDDVRANNSAIWADVEAVDVLAGSQFYGGTNGDGEARSVPDRDAVLAYYLQNGTWIDRDALPTVFPSIIRNGGFENGDTEWAGKSCTIASQSDRVYEGLSALEVTGRSDKTDGALQDVTSLLLSGKSMNVSAAFRSGDVGAAFYFHLIVNSSFGTSEFTAGPVVLSAADTWQEVQMSVTPWWWGNLNSAELVIDTSPSSLYGWFYYGGSTADFEIDKVVLRESSSVRNMDHVLLSPGNNPFGDTNPDGIYLLDMRGHRVVIRNSRIVGTLVLIDPSDASELGDNAALSMSPAVPGFPSLIVADGEVYLNPSDRALSENALNINLNPGHTPHPAVGSDDDMDDTFASGIEGLIYSSNRLRLRNSNSIHGCIISTNDIDIEDRLSLTYDSQYYRNPPPGFSGPEQIRLLLGSARRTVTP
jgi:hypothetical protein